MRLSHISLQDIQLLSFLHLSSFVQYKHIYLKTPAKFKRSIFHHLNKPEIVIRTDEGGVTLTKHLREDDHTPTSRFEDGHHEMEQSHLATDFNMVVQKLFGREALTHGSF